MKHISDLHKYFAKSECEWTEDNISECLNKNNIKRLTTALPKRGRVGTGSLFHDCAFHLTSEIFNRLIDAVPRETLEDCLQSKTTSGVTPFSLIANYQNSTAFIKCLDYMTKTDYDYPRILNYTVKYQNAASLDALLKKAFPDSLAFTSKIALEHYNVILISAAYLQTTEVFLALLNKVDNQDYFNKSMTIQYTDKNTPLHYIAQYQNTKAFITTIDKMSDDCLKNVLNIKNTTSFVTPLHCIMRFQSDASIQKIIDRADRIDLKNALLIKDEFGQTSLDFIARARSITSMQSLLKKITAEAKDLESVARTIWFRHERGEPALTDAALNNTLFTALAKLIKMKQYYYQDSLITMYYYLERLNKNQQVETAAFKSNDSLTQEIKKNKILIKIVAPDRYDDFLEQLCNYTYRPYLRRLKPFSRFKFVHLANLAVPYIKNRHLNKKIYTHTKKSSMTMIGSHLNTPVFGHHDPDRPLVGYLFKKDECIIKAMFRQDQGTFSHQHYASNKKEAELSIQHTPQYNYTDENEFIKTVNDETQLTNEVFVKAKREAIAAIVVARTDRTCITIAEQRQEDAYHCLGINVPIVYYDNQAGTVVTLKEKLIPTEHTHVPVRLTYMKQYAKTGFKATALLLGLFIAASYLGEYCTQDTSSSNTFKAEDLFMKIANTLLTPLKKCTDLPDDSILPLGAALILSSGILTGAVAGKMTLKKIRA